MGEVGSKKDIFERLRPPGIMLLGLLAPLSSSLVKLSCGRND
jgi:hypothetical protein